MSLFALIAALLLEQMHPLHSRKYLQHGLAEYVDFFSRNFNAGERRQGRIAWMLAMLAPFVFVVSAHHLLLSAHALFAWAFSVLVLYATMGFRQFSRYYTAIRQALLDKKPDLAREKLSEWTGRSCRGLNHEEVARYSIEQALLASHRNVFGVVFWFVVCMLLGFGPVGAILYRLAVFLDTRWSNAADTQLVGFSEFAHQAYQLMEWPAVRLTAATFAIVGDFEDTAYCWRNQAASWPSAAAGILLASGAGALGVKLGNPVELDGQVVFRPEIGLDDDADTDYMQSATGLVWRALVFWLVMLLLLTLASLLG